MIVELMKADMMESVARIGGTVQLDETRVEYTAQDILEAFRVFREYNIVGAQPKASPKEPSKAAGA